MSNETRFVELPGSARTLPAGANAVARAAADTRIEVSVYLKPRAETGLLDAVPVHERRARLAHHRAQAHRQDLAGLEAFAAAHGLEIVERAPERRLVRLGGTVAAFESAFRTELHDVIHGGRHFRGRTGALSVPASLESAIESVLGLDDRPVARPHFITHAEAAGTAHLPNAVGGFYDFPTAYTGTGQTIALIELGGGYNDADNAQAFAAMNLASAPSVTAVSVDGATNSPGGDADGEVALDIQVAGGNAPGAAIVVYFAPNTDQGFADAITQAAHDTANAVTVISISWGGPESSWTAQSVATMNSAIEDAGTLGISVFVASGDNLATDGVSDGAAHVDFPASSPYAIGCGGTAIATANGAITDETVWNDGTSGSGGGFSALAAIPSFQQGGSGALQGATMRGVPDVAGDAAPGTGYTIVLKGQAQTVGGTSAVAPLWAGLTALLNQALARNLGFFLPTIYARATGLVDITEGDNIPTGSEVGFKAGPGWDACTGLGRPDGAALLAAFQGTAPQA